MNPKRLAYIKSEMERADKDTDYYEGGLASAGMGLELIEEIERLQAELINLKKALNEHLIPEHKFLVPE